MKALVILIALILISGCTAQHRAHSTQAPTQLVYSSQFKVVIPASFMAGATVFYSDELGATTPSGQSFSGQIISREKDGLPENLDITLYPKYLFKIRSTSDLSAGLSRSFSKTSREIDNSYGLSNLDITKTGNQTIYSLCKDNKCFAMVVKKGFNEHIFYAHTQKISRAELIRILSGYRN